MPPEKWLVRSECLRANGLGPRQDFDHCVYENERLAMRQTVINGLCIKWGFRCGACSILDEVGKFPASIHQRESCTVAVVLGIASERRRRDHEVAFRGEFLLQDGLQVGPDIILVPVLEDPSPSPGGSRR